MDKLMQLLAMTGIAPATYLEHWLTAMENAHPAIAGTVDAIMPIVKGAESISWGQVGQIITDITEAFIAFQSGQSWTTILTTLAQQINAILNPPAKAA